MHMNAVADEFGKKAIIRQGSAGNAGGAMRERRLRIIGVRHAACAPAGGQMCLLGGGTGVADGYDNAMRNCLLDKILCAGKLGSQRDHAHG